MMENNNDSSWRFVYFRTEAAADELNDTLMACPVSLAFLYRLTYYTDFFSLPSSFHS